jgi:hypothetical protein
MALMKQPSHPIPKNFRPPQSNVYRVRDGDSWAKVARRHAMSDSDLIQFNFNTSDPQEVNWYLKHYVGCNKQTRDGKNFMFSATASPGIIYVPREVTHVPTIRIKVRRPRKREKITFWVRGTLGSVSVWKALGNGKLMGDLVMKINDDWDDWYAWQLSASFAKLSLPIKEAPPISVGEIATTGHSFKFDRAVFDPREDWRDKTIHATIALTVLSITIKNAFPSLNFPGYEPIQGQNSRDLTLHLEMDSPQLSADAGIGSIRNGRQVKRIWAPNEA